MSKGAITLTIVFEGMNLNRDEGVGGNILTLKKLHRGDGKVYTFMSRQALRYCITKKLVEEKGWRLTEVVKETEDKKGQKKGVSQFNLAKENIITSEELDAFGYMYTIGDQMALTRTSTVRLTNVVSLESFPFDQSLNANHEMARRARGTPDLWNTEDHLSLYKYSLVIDLDRLGYDEWCLQEDAKCEGEKIKGKHKESFEFKKEINGKNGKSIGKVYIDSPNSKIVKFEVDIEKKIKRITDILEAIITLNREIQGRPENLTPLLVIGGIVKVKTPLAHPYVEIKENTKREINLSLLKEGENFINDYATKFGESKRKIIVKGIVEEKFEIKGTEINFERWKTPREAIKELINFIKNQDFKDFLAKNEISSS